MRANTLMALTKQLLCVINLLAHVTGTVLPPSSVSGWGYQPPEDRKGSTTGGQRGPGSGKSQSLHGCRSSNVEDSSLGVESQTRKQEEGPAVVLADRYPEEA